MKNDIQSNVNPSNKRCISKLFVLYNSSKGLVILSSTPKVQDNSEKGGNSRKKDGNFWANGGNCRKKGGKLGEGGKIGVGGTISDNTRRQLSIY
jgi:hypothetical protein